jgi:DNA-binding transcriptional LysR family regulator
MPKRHELSAKPVVYAADLARYPFIAISPNTLLGQGLNKLFEKLGVSLNIFVETATATSASEMVARGLGITIVPGCIGSLLGSQRVELKPWDPGFKSTLGFFYGSRGSSPLVEDFSKILVGTMLELDRRFTFPLPAGNSSPSPR